MVAVVICPISQVAPEVETWGKRRLALSDTYEDFVALVKKSYATTLHVWPSPARTSPPS